MIVCSYCLRFKNGTAGLSKGQLNTRKAKGKERCFSFTITAAKIAGVAKDLLHRNSLAGLDFFGCCLYDLFGQVVLF